MGWWDIDLTGLFNLPKAQGAIKSGDRVSNDSALASCIDASGAAHVFYISDGKIVHGYFANSTLAYQTLTPATLAPGTALSALYDANGGHVFCQGIDSKGSLNWHLHQLTSAMWSDQDMTPGEGTVTPGAGISSFLDTAGTAHVFYVGGTDVNVLSFNSGVWTNQDLTSQANAGLGNAVLFATGPSPLVSFQDGSGEHVFYLCQEDIYVHQLYLQNSLQKWVDKAVPSSSKGIANGSGLTGYVDQYGEHVFYVSNDLHVHHLNFTAGNWADVDLTATYSGPLTAAASALSSFGDGYGIHAAYIGADQHVHQMYYDNSEWGDQDLSGTATLVEQAQIPLAATGSAIASLANNVGELIFYISADQHVHLLLFANLPIVPPFAVACPTAASGAVGAAYSSTIGVSGGLPPYNAYLIASGEIPPPLKLNPSNGVIEGTPTTAGTFSFTVSVIDATGAKATTGGCVITIAGPPTVGCPPNGEVGVPYSATLVGGGGEPPYTFTVSGLPQGLSLIISATDSINGTPATAGVFSLVFTVKDAKGATGEVSCSMTIAPPLTLSCPVAGIGYAGQPYDSSFAASGGTPPYTFGIIAGLPQGLIQGSNGGIGGTPAELGTFAFTASVTDSVGATATANCQITIGGTLLITANYLDVSVAPPLLLGPAAGLNFVNANTGQSVTSIPGPSVGTYFVLGVTNGEDLGPGPGFGEDYLVNWTPGSATWMTTYIIPVTLSGTSGTGSAQIYVASARPL